MKTKTKKKTEPKVEEIACWWCRQWRRYYPADITTEAIHFAHQPKSLQKEEEKEAEYVPQVRDPNGRKIVRNPVQDPFNPNDCPVDLLGTDEKSVAMWAEMVRDDHESKEEHLTIRGLCSYIFAMRERDYSERRLLATLIRRIYATERRRELESDVQWEARLCARAIANAGDSESPSVRSTAGTKRASADAQSAPVPTKRPGVIAKIVEVLRAASKKNPVTKDQLLKTLCETFPEREKDAMRGTVSSQVPNGLLKEKNLTVHHTADKSGWWLPKESD